MMPEAPTISPADISTDLVESEIGWSRLSLARRIACVCALRHALAEDPMRFAEAVALPWPRRLEETLAAEVLPLAEACKFLERHARRILRPRRLGRRFRPIWLFGVDAEIRREPLGCVLIIGPGNYPLMLPGIQIVQALVAGNRVLFKPAPGTAGIAQLLVDTLHRDGVPPGALRLLDEAPESIRTWLGRIDKTIFTGSSENGRAVLRLMAEYAIPSVMELSGSDSAFVMPGADIDLAAQCLRFGAQLNSGNSCIAPRRVYVHASIAAALLARLDKSSALEVIRVEDMEQARRAAANNPHRLGASIFGPSGAAQRLAESLEVGCVVINDMIVPTADPRVPFGGRGESGFGVTRGPEGLLEMTAAKVILRRRHGPRFHLAPKHKHSAEIFAAQLAAGHARTWRERLAGWGRLLASARRGRIPSPGTPGEG
jgi:acyl-CoA reductase-like NAD-dependent aldehyde dehydrogenase